MGPTSNNSHGILVLVEVGEEVTIVTPHITTEELNSIGTTEPIESQLEMGKTLPVTTYQYIKQTGHASSEDISPDRDNLTTGEFLTSVSVVQHVAQTTSNWVKYSSLFSSTFPPSAFTDTLGFNTCSRGNACSAL